MIRTYLVATGLRARAAETVTSERGQTTAEYVGVVLLLAAVAGLFLGTSYGAEIADAIQGAVSSAISRLTNPGG